MKNVKPFKQETNINPFSHRPPHFMVELAYFLFLITWFSDLDPIPKVLIRSANIEILHIYYMHHLRCMNPLLKFDNSFDLNIKLTHPVHAVMESCFLVQSYVFWSVRPSVCSSIHLSISG